jgi:hypothetical protein
MPTNQQPESPIVVWVKDNPEFVSGLADIGLLVVTISLVLTRNSLSKIKASLKQTVEKLKQPKPTPDYTLDASTAFKHTVYFYLNQLLNQTSAKWVSLGVLSNGKVSEWGYHFSAVSWDFSVYEPTCELPIDQLNKLDPIKLAVALFDQLCDSDQPRLTQDVLGYHCQLFGLRFGNILVAVVAIGYQDKPEVDSVPLCSTLTQLQTAISSLVKPPTANE